MDARLRWITSTLIGNLLVYDTMLIGATDLLCHNPLHEGVFGNDESARRKFFEFDAGSGVPVRVVALDFAPFAEVAERLIEGDTLSGVKKKETLRDRARILDACNIPIVRYDASAAMNFSAALNALRSRYTEGLWWGFTSLASDSRYPRGVDAQIRDAALLVARDVEARVRATRMPLSQSDIWGSIENLRLPEHVHTELQRLSDLAYQCAMGRGTNGHMSTSVGSDSRFMSATLWSEYRMQYRPPGEKRGTADEVIDKALSLIVRSQALDSLTLDEALRLREKPPLVELRAFLSDRRERAFLDRMELDQRLRELRYPLEVLAVADEDEAAADHTMGTLEAMYEQRTQAKGVELLSTLLMPMISKVGSGLGAVAGTAAAAYSGVSSGEVLGATIAGGVVGEFGARWAGARLKKLQFQPNIAGAPPITENLFRTAQAVAEVRGIR